MPRTYSTEALLSNKPVICTIGHSTHPIETFIELLRKNRVAHVLDVRTVPRSRHNPQFGTDTLRSSLAAAGIAYTHIPELGGLRRARADSINSGWRNTSFRGYADYMQTEEFSKNLERVVELNTASRCALMCAEAVPWRCHRSLIADALTLRGMLVEDILGMQEPKPHVVTKWAKVDGTSITYPPEQGELLA